MMVIEGFPLGVGEDKRGSELASTTQLFLSRQFTDADM